MRSFQGIILIFFTSILISQGQPSDFTASAIADSVIAAMGGKKNWDEVHYLKWNFFGKRLLYWDKWTGDVRIEIPAKKLLILTNINTRQGHVYRDNKELMESDSNAYFMDRGYKIWANDSYWLIMPFKLKDPGVHLSLKDTVTLMHEGQNAGKIDTYLLELKFDKVGVTPENKYIISVSGQSYMITAWSYFEKFSDEKPEISNPWLNYKRYGKILLSDDRGPDEGKISEIAVMDQVPAGLFDKP